MDKEYTDIVINTICDHVEGADTGPLFQIQYLEGREGVIY